MSQTPPAYQRIFDIDSDRELNALALEIFHWQKLHNPVYRAFVTALPEDFHHPSRARDIPCMPIEAFKNHKVVTGSYEVAREPLVFESSGTTRTGMSRHWVLRPEIYREAFRRGFRRFYGPPRDFRILALLPSYLERSSSSLVYMMADLIRASGHQDSGFFLNDRARLRQLLNNPDPDRKTLLIGVSFALLDLVGDGPMDLKNKGHTLVMETGGMKGRRAEPVRSELHRELCMGLGVDNIHSEYGMTELLSQAYSHGAGLFDTPPWMKFFIRDLHDPLSHEDRGRTGGLNILDLVNVDSCCFLATSDLARQTKSGAFEILGRMDHSDLRGCNLMVS